MIIQNILLAPDVATKYHRLSGLNLDAENYKEKVPTDLETDESPFGFKVRRLGWANLPYFISAVTLPISTSPHLKASGYKISLSKPTSLSSSYLFNRCMFSMTKETK